MNVQNYDLMVNRYVWESVWRIFIYSKRSDWFDAIGEYETKEQAEEAMKEMIRTGRIS